MVILLIFRVLDADVPHGIFFVFGFLCMKSYKSWKRNGNVRSLVAYLILIQFIVFSVARIYTGLSTRALSLVWLFLLFRKVRIGMSEKGGRV